jgi:hypothetical protein
MSFLPSKIVKILEKKFRPNSIKTYSCSIKRIHKDFYKKDKYSEKVLLDFDNNKKNINKIKNIGTRKILVASILTILKTKESNKKIIEKYKEYFDEIIILYDDVNMYKQASKSEINKKKKIGSMKDLSDKREEFLKIAKKSNKDRDWNKYLIASLYTYLPPLRQDEYVDMYIVSLSSNSNYSNYCDIMKNNFIDIKNNKIIICKSKTKKKYKIRIFDLPINLKNAINLFRKENDIESKKLLNGTMYKTQTGLSAFIKRTLGVSSSMLRKLYISEMLEKMGDRKNMLKEKNIKKRKEVAYIMGHSLKMQEFTYSRLAY